jgi:hypothetical protein
MCISAPAQTRPALRQSPSLWITTTHGPREFVPGGRHFRTCPNTATEFMLPGGGVLLCRMCVLGGRTVAHQAYVPCEAPCPLVALAMRWQASQPGGTNPFLSGPSSETLLPDLGVEHACSTLPKLHLLACLLQLTPIIQPARSVNQMIGDLGVGDSPPASPLPPH